ncbi:hypothetical protein FOQG_18388 [Fusarium oxysporum f. sp. raphani 54005]|uniref:Protein kinase domain-containing protein n=1 Tax=Fusarium oxysporum f. sp. raphani 54005 TaxID=1089458 RepID=X0BDI0_FUSOX|nr:hypothetical protein FOQG_18388 [Fusarium oxysporum f. sp. raphani 54005]
MSRRKGSQSAVSELPPCEGPKLNVFQHHKSRIQWLERLDNEDEDVTSSQGYVFRALIRGHEYAVKVIRRSFHHDLPAVWYQFKFFDPMSTEYFWGPSLGEDTPLDTAAYYTDPFYAECRAYGRIHEAIKQRVLKSDIAVPCHGFLFLRPNDQEALKNLDIDLGLEEIDLDYQKSTIGGLRARAIVKEIASSDSGVNSKSIRKILSKVTTLNKAGIYNMDIRIDNFRDGKIVDFGSSWTEPHALLDSLSQDAALESKIADRVMFDQMVEEEEIENLGEVKALHPMRLRSQSVR